MKKRCSNKGFSLVELIIVIAIMAILIGVMAPQLIKYIEKAKVANDTQIADTMHSAFTYALMDPEVVTATDGSEDWVAMFTTPNQVIFPYSGAAHWGVPGLTVNCKFCEAVEEVLGYNPFTSNVRDFGFKSTSALGNGLIYPRVDVNSSGTGFAVYLRYTDRTGNKNGNGNVYTYDGLEDEDCKVIYVK